MKTLIIIVLFLFSNCLLGQNQTEKYYALVNKAELSICKKKNNQASKKYHRAFKQINMPFIRDIRNAFLCEYFGNKNRTKLERYSILLKNFGVPISDIIDSTNRSDLFYELVKIQDNSEIKYNPTLSNKVDSLLQIDQKVRKICPTYSDSCVKAVIEADSANMLALVRIERQIGKVREYSVGRLSMFYFNIMIKHWTMWQWYPLRDELLQDAKSGLYDARQFARLEDDYYMHSNGSSKHNVYGIDSYYIVGNVLFICISSTEKTKLDDKRKEIFLESMDELATKTIFLLAYDEHFLLNPFVVSWVLGNEEDDNIYAQEFIR